VCAWQQNCELALVHLQAAATNINILSPSLHKVSCRMPSSGKDRGETPDWSCGTDQASRNGRSGHILKYPPRFMAAMGITSRSRGSIPGSCAELEPGAACYSFSQSPRSLWQESTASQGVSGKHSCHLSLLVGQCARLPSTCKVTCAMTTPCMVFNLAHAQRNCLQLRSRCHVSLCNDFSRAF
jgi:hypothetical protein